MNDLARQAAGLIANVSGSRERIPIGMTVEILNSVGVLVSHEQAALLREVERMLIEGGHCEISVWDEGGSWFAWACSVRGVGRMNSIRSSPAAALKAALDAAGVPDAKGT